jgi:hypothetical protein
LHAKDHEATEMLVVDTTFTTNKQSIDKQKFKRQMCELYAIREKKSILSLITQCWYFILLVAQLVRVVIIENLLKPKT